MDQIDLTYFHSVLGTLKGLAPTTHLSHHELLDSSHIWMEELCVYRFYLNLLHINNGDNLFPWKVMVTVTSRTFDKVIV